METKKTPPRIPPPLPKGAPVTLAMEVNASPTIGVNKETNRAQFLKGNKLWMLAPMNGRPRKIDDPADLWQKAINYFNWCDANPWYRSELVKHQGSAEEYAVPLGRPYTIDGFMVVLGVSASYFRSAKLALQDKEDANTATPLELELLEVMVSIEAAIRNQQIEGASVGVFNSNLISRINGIADNVNQNNTGEVRQNIVVRDQKTADDMAALDKAV